MTSPMSEWRSSIKQQTTTVDKDMETGKLWHRKHCFRNFKLVDPLWKTVWRVVKKLEIKLPYQVPHILAMERPHTVYSANGLHGQAPLSPPSMIMCRGPRRVTTVVSTNPQARAWQPAPSAACTWPPKTTTGAACVPLPVTAPVEVLGTLGMPSSTTRVSPRLTQATGGWVSLLGTPLSHSWPQCWSPQSTHNLSRLPEAWSTVTWLGKPQGSSLVASAAKPMLGP